MSATELDATDAAIVHELQADGRLPFETLAGRIGLSRAAARLRVRRLLDSGTIRVAGVPHPAVRDIGALAWLAVSVFGGASEVAESIAELPETTLVSLASGRFPVVVEAHGNDMAGLTSTIDRIRTLPGVRDIDTAVYTRVHKDPHLVSSEPPDVRPDEVDQRLLRLLEHDGRLSFAELSAHVGLSAGAVRSRVMRLLQGRAVRVTALVDPAAVGRERHGGFAARIEDSGDDAAKEIASWDQTQFLAHCLGGADLVGTAATSSVGDLHTVFERVRALPGVRVTETWVHLEHVKERLP